MATREETASVAFPKGGKVARNATDEDALLVVEEDAVF